MSDRKKAEAAPPPFMHRGGPWAHFQATPVRARDTRATVGRVWRYLAVHRAWLIVTACVVTVGSLLNLAGPYLMARAIDLIATRAGIDAVLRVCGIMAATHLGMSVLTWVQTYIMAGVAPATVKGIRRDLFSALQNLPLAFFDRTPTGDTMSRVTNDVDNVSMTLSDSVAQLTGGVLGMVGVVVAMFLAPLVSVAAELVHFLMEALLGLDLLF